MVNLQFGDVLLFPTDKYSPVYKYAKNKVNKFFADLLEHLTGQQYAHVGIYLTPSKDKNKFWSLEAIDQGVWLVERSVSDFQYLDVIRHKKIDKDHIIEMENLVYSYWNKPYDWTSLLLNGITELAGIIGFEEYIEKTFQEVRDTPHTQICSELVARIYADVGLEFSKKPEYISPMDIYKNENFKIIIEHK